ncbi:transcription termination factor NusA, partial [Pseudophaeobacter sp.]|uniref:transcription termination factor NusA n=1 Tax=Pseudophaeobacter sp. TaxID=1971739 RepID=UPI00261E98FC
YGLFLRDENGKPLVIDRKTGKATFTRVRSVVEDEALENYQAEFTVEQAKQYMEDPKVGDTFVEEVPPVEMGRIAAQSAKQVILQRVREAERDRQFEEFQDRAGTIINALVKREEYGNVIVDVGAGEGILRRNEKIGRESYRPNDRIRCYIKDVRREPRGPQIFLSRTAPEFMAELFKMEVPEIYDGIIQIKAVARDPGSRAKIAVISNDGSIDPVGACVGMRGSRVQAVVNELQGEKIDIIPWNDDQPTFLVNALQPAEVSKVVLDEEAGKIEVVVPEEQLSLAIGRRGQNVRLASQLTGLDIDIMTEEEESARRQKEFEARTGLFMETLDLDEFFAQLLVSEGFTNLEEVAYVELDELTVIDGVDEGTAEELQARARDYLEAKAKAAIDAARALGAEDSLIQFDGLTPVMIEALAKDDIKTLEDFATCADWELAGGWTNDNGERIKDDGILEPFGMSLEEAQDLVMTARVMLGWVDPDDLIGAEDGAEDLVEGDEEEAEA